MICGRKAPYYDAGRGLRLWRTTDIGLHKAEICADSYRVNCPEHGIVTASVPWARHNSRYTYDFEQTVAWLAMNCSKVAVSWFMRISWNSVGPVISRVRTDLDLCPENRFDGLEKIGIDETSYRKGHKYMTVVVNHVISIKLQLAHPSLLKNCSKTIFNIAIKPSFKMLWEYFIRL